jgi:hypothetical protein
MGFIIKGTVVILEKFMFNTKVRSTFTVESIYSDFSVAIFTMYLFHLFIVYFVLFIIFLDLIEPLYSLRQVDSRAASQHMGSLWP